MNKINQKLEQIVATVASIKRSINMMENDLKICQVPSRRRYQNWKKRQDSTTKLKNSSKVKKCTPNPTFQAPYQKKIKGIQSTWSNVTSLEEVFIFSDPNQSGKVKGNHLLTTVHQSY